LFPVSVPLGFLGWKAGGAVKRRGEAPLAQMVYAKS